MKPESDMVIVHSSMNSELKQAEARVHRADWKKDICISIHLFFVFLGYQIGRHTVLNSHH
jgi:hypothetical protein